MSFTFHIKENKFVVNDYCNFIRKRSSIQQAIIDIAIKRGYTEFFLSREIQGGKERENIGNYTKIHPDVYLLKHFDIIVKTFESRDEMLYELSIYELIKNVYKTQ